MIGGEAEASWGWLKFGQWFKWAQQHGAAMFLLEHRSGQAAEEENRYQKLSVLQVLRIVRTHRGHEHGEHGLPQLQVREEDVPRPGHPLVCRQGLQDLAHFITAMNTKYSFTSKA